MHIGRIDRAADPRKPVPAARLANGLTAQRVEIVHEKEKNRQAAFERLGPETFILRHGGKVHRFPYGTATSGAVADIGDRDPRIAVAFLEERGARGNSG